MSNIEKYKIATDNIKASNELKRKTLDRIRKRKKF